MWLNSLDAANRSSAEAFVDPSLVNIFGVASGGALRHPPFDSHAAEGSAVVAGIDALVSYCGAFNGLSGGPRPARATRNIYHDQGESSSERSFLNLTFCPIQ